jgi:hypothetical protein
VSQRQAGGDLLAVAVAGRGSMLNRQAVKGRQLVCVLPFAKATG